MKTAAGRPAEEIITRLAQHIDYFNKYQHPHSIRMADLAARLANRLGLLPLDIDAIVEAALLHDIGLYEMAPAYLSNPGPLSPEQRMDLWRHSIIGEQAMARRNASRHSQLLVRWHHEWWNGAGYPDMLSFEEIPIGARVLHAVEIYCALIVNRPYRPALTHDQAVELLRASAGVQCDPFLVRELLALLQESGSQFSEGAAALADTGPEAPGSESARADELIAVTQLAPAPEAPGAPEPIAATSESLPEATQLVPAPEPPRPSEPAAAIEAAPAPEAAPGADSLVLDPFWPLQAPSVHPEPWAPAAQSHAGQSLDKDHPPPAGTSSRGWLPSPYITGSLLGFQVSVLRQIDFRCVAIPFCGWGDLVWYLAALGKQVLSNDPRPWAALAGRTLIESEPLDDEQVFRILQDTYIPGVRMSNPELRRWFGEADAWWMDNLRRRALDDPAVQERALLLGLRAGDYAQSFNESTSELKRPLTVIFRELAANTPVRLATHPHNRAYNLPVQQFLSEARADMMYLNLPSGQAEFGARSRAAWRDTWLAGRVPDLVDDFSQLATLPQSKKAYLEMVDRILVSASRIRKWAVECRDMGLASARDISDLVKAHRTIQATYSKDLTEVPGGLRNYVMVSELTDRA